MRTFGGYQARLRGGPYDGDIGIVPFLAEKLYAWECGNPRCPERGLHWEPNEPPAVEVKTVRYDLVEETREAQWVDYVYPELADPAALLRSTVTASA